jgi:diaminopimelate epimerase
VPQLHLSRLEATGNDFLVLVDLDDRFGLDVLPREVRARLCDRAHGPGADGLIRVLPGTAGAALTFELTNADGSPAEMSGNGMRCLAAVAVWNRYVEGSAFSVVDGAGRVHAVEYAETPETAFARVDMGPATFDPERIPLDAPSPFGLHFDVDGETFAADAAGMGNPHCVVVVDDPATTAVASVGPAIESDARFPNRTNVMFVAVDGKAALRMRSWERGVGETRSCGTGACAATAVTHRRGVVGEAVAVDVAGGRLNVTLEPETIWLGGPVTQVGELAVDLRALGVAP